MHECEGQIQCPSILMFTIKIKGAPTIGNLQGAFELSVSDKRATWVLYSKCLDKFVQYFGPDREPDYIVRSEIPFFEAWLAEKQNYSKEFIVTVKAACRAYYAWMRHMGFATTDPFAAASNRKYLDVKVVRE